MVLQIPIQLIHAQLLGNMNKVATDVFLLEESLLSEDHACHHVVCCLSDSVQGTADSTFLRRMIKLSQVPVYQPWLFYWGSIMTW